MIRPSFCSDETCWGPDDCPCEAICRAAQGTCNRFPCGHAMDEDDRRFAAAEEAHERSQEWLCTDGRLMHS